MMTAFRQIVRQRQAAQFLWMTGDVRAMIADGEDWLKAAATLSSDPL